MYNLVIYHKDCADGFGAAWAASGALPITTKFVPAAYNEAPPDVKDQHVLILDFSYPREVLVRMREEGGAKSITILDHHKTALEALEDFMVGSDGRVSLDRPDVFAEGARDVAVLPIRAWFDMERSGAQLAWSYFYGGFEPMLIGYVGNRDLWKLDELPKMREVHAWLMSHPFRFDVWDKCDTQLKDHWSNVIEEGTAILRAHDRTISELLPLTRRNMIIGGVEVPVANMPYHMASDAAGAMASEPGVPFAATYYDNHKGQRVFSLRSRGEDGADVSAIAKQYGGGGHRNAAGFRISVSPLYETGELGAFNRETVPSVGEVENEPERARTP